MRSKDGYTCRRCEPPAVFEDPVEFTKHTTMHFDGRHGAPVGPAPLYYLIENGEIVADALDLEEALRKIRDEFPNAEPWHHQTWKRKHGIRR